MSRELNKLFTSLCQIGLGIVFGGASLGAATVSGDAIEIASDITHPNGNVYDQVLMRGSLATVRADAGQIVRVSFVDLNDTIVQVEFSGSGSLTLFLADATGPAPAIKYNQPTVAYMRGHASLLISGSDATTNLAVFSVGRLTAVNPALFRSDVTYDGVADIAVVDIEPDPAIPAGQVNFGGIRMGNVEFFATEGYTGIFAPDVNVRTAVIIGDIAAYDAAVPVLLFGDASKFSVLTVAGGSLFQPNGLAVQTKGFDRIAMTAGTSSVGTYLPAQFNLGRVERNGQDVTGTIMTYPAIAVTIGSTTTTTTNMTAVTVAPVVTPITLVTPSPGATTPLINPIAVSPSG